MSGANPGVGARVLVPMDLSGHGESAFLHALAIALATRGEVFPFHVCAPGSTSDWHVMPRTRDVLHRWGRIDADASPEALEALGIKVHPHDVVSRRIVGAVAAEAAARPYDLVVMHTHARQAVGSWAEGSISRVIARQSATPVLFLPARASGLVSSETGEVSLRHVLLPIGDAEEAAVEVRAAEVFGRMLGVKEATGTLLRVGQTFPPLQLGADWAWQTRIEHGPVAVTIAEMAGALDVDLLVMVTRGHDSLGDQLSGSVSERVVDKATCPVLVVPLPG